MLQAKASAGGSVMLPARSPLKSMKFNLRMARPMMPIKSSGSDRDAQPGKQPVNAGRAKNRLEEARARAKTHSSKEESNAKLTKGEVSVRRHMPDVRADPAYASQNKCDNKWSAG